MLLLYVIFTKINGRQAERERQTYIQAERETDRYTGRETDRRTLETRRYINI